MKLHRKLLQYEQLPRGYRIAYHNPISGHLVCYPIGLNWGIGFLHWLWELTFRWRPSALAIFLARVRLAGVEYGRSLGNAGEIKRLQTIVDRMPKTKDGVPVILGDTVWKLFEDRPEPYRVQVGYVGLGAIQHENAEQELLVDRGMGLGDSIESCYSTPEAAKVAHD